MKSLIIRRLLAFCMDYLIIVGYALLLFLFTLWLDPAPLTVIEGQVVGFFTLTLPVFLYFFIMERSVGHATFGKRIMKVKVYARKGKDSGILWRNILKFLPWEVAHAGVHWMMYYSRSQLDTPIWVWILLILPQLVVLIYIITIFLSKGKSSLYDQISGTAISLLPKTVS